MVYSIGCNRGREMGVRLVMDFEELKQSLHLLKIAACGFTEIRDHKTFAGAIEAIDPGVPLGNQPGQKPEALFNCLFFQHPNLREQMGDQMKHFM